MRILFSLEELSQQKIYKDVNSLPRDLDSVYRLDLSEQKLTKIPEIVSKLNNLQELNLSQNNLSNLNGFENISNLQVLNIGMNNFKIFPIEITKFKSLKSLSIWWNEIKTFPADFFTQNTQIEELDMTSMFEFDFKSNLNKIHSFKNLKRLNLGNNQIPYLTIQFDKLENLEVFSYIRQDSINLKDLCIKLSNCKKLKTIHLSVNNIKFLPEEILFLASLEELNLFQNKIKVLPADILKMKNLKEITLIDNPVDANRIKEIESKMPWTKIIY
ncbi:leucine-rich repeat domain-containing protein [Flavobacterium sp.]|uniref:leucine-rich repeat domain-containing protein n=1 Tax=Flavobacterium sp. TaxID=239 RepID=UPI0040480306